jgi:hypothetical protein
LSDSETHHLVSKAMGFAIAQPILQTCLKHAAAVRSSE